MFKSSGYIKSRSLYKIRGGGGGGKALTMTMTPWNFTHGQWSKWLFCGQISWLDQRFTILIIENLYFVHGDGQNWCFCGRISW